MTESLIRLDGFIRLGASILRGAKPRQAVKLAYSCYCRSVRLAGFAAADLCLSKYLANDQRPENRWDGSTYFSIT